MASHLTFRSRQASQEGSLRRCRKVLRLMVDVFPPDPLPLELVDDTDEMDDDWLWCDRVEGAVGMPN